MRYALEHDVDRNPPRKLRERRCLQLFLCYSSRPSFYGEQVMAEQAQKPLSYILKRRAREGCYRVFESWLAAY
jgi:hypothetical protein